MTLLTLLCLFYQSLLFAQADTWRYRARLSKGKIGMIGGAANGKIYIFGGSDQALSTLSETEEFDPVANTWTLKTDMPTGRVFGCACTVNGKIYVIGGSRGGESNKNEEYDPLADTWAAKANMPTLRSSLSCYVVDGKIYAIGGFTDGTEQRLVEVYDPMTDTWTTKAERPRGGVVFASWVANSEIHVMGGFGDNSTSGFTDTYDTVNDSWTTSRASRLTARFSTEHASENGIVYVTGGVDQTGQEAVDDLEVYDIASNTWTAKKSMDTVRERHVAIAYSGKLYAIGGFGGGGIRWNTVEEYTLNTPTSVGPENNIIDSFVLHQNYPNPFNPGTRISYEISAPTSVTLRIVNLLGQNVKTLVDQNQPAGVYDIDWNGKDDYGQQVAGGIYLYRLEAGDVVQTRKMILAQ